MSTKRDRLIIIFVVLAGILIFAGGVTIAQGQGNIDSGFINSWQATLLSQIHPQTADFAINTQGPNSTYICGSITDVHWTISGSPYIVTCNARLDSGILTIDPGVIIKFLTGTELDIYGTLLAIGLENNLIYFTSDNVTPGPGDWNGMNFYSGSNGSILSYTVVEYGRGITSDSTSIQIEFSTIQYNSPGIYLNSSQSSISHNSIISNTAQSGAGIYIRYGTAIIDSNNISWNSAGTRGGGRNLCIWMEYWRYNYRNE
jgi:hypothetical protein